MSVPRHIARLGSLAGLVDGPLTHCPATAGQVVIFDSAVSQAAEHAKIFWPGKAAAGSSVRLTRSRPMATLRFETGMKNQRRNSNHVFAA